MPTFKRADCSHLRSESRVLCSANLGRSVPLAPDTTRVPSSFIEVSHSHAGGTSQGRAGLSLGDLATDEVFKDEVLAGRAATSGGVQRSAVRTVFRALKNVFEPMLLEPAAVPTRMPAQATSVPLCSQPRDEAC
jgi:hypothetical protein